MQEIALTHGRAKHDVSCWGKRKTFETPTSPKKLVDHAEERQSHFAFQTFKMTRKKILWGLNWAGWWKGTPRTVGHHCQERTHFYLNYLGWGWDAGLAFGMIFKERKKTQGDSPFLKDMIRFLELCFVCGRRRQPVRTEARDGTELTKKKVAGKESVCVFES